MAWGYLNVICLLYCSQRNIDTVYIFFTKDVKPEGIILNVFSLHSILQHFRAGNFAGLSICV